MMHELSNKQLVTLATVLAGMVLLAALFGAWSLWEAPAVPVKSGGELLAQTAPLQSVLQQLPQSPTFQYLVSYTDKGFAPPALEVKKGDTVRFTNNSSEQL